MSPGTGCQPVPGESVTHVSGINRYLCERNTPCDCGAPGGMNLGTGSRRFRSLVLPSASPLYLERRRIRDDPAHEPLRGFRVEPGLLVDVVDPEISDAGQHEPRQLVRVPRVRGEPDLLRDRLHQLERE